MIIPRVVRTTTQEQLPPVIVWLVGSVVRRRWEGRRTTKIWLVESLDGGGGEGLEFHLDDDDDVLLVPRASTHSPLRSSSSSIDCTQLRVFSWEAQTSSTYSSRYLRLLCISLRHNSTTTSIATYGLYYNYLCSSPSTIFQPHTIIGSPGQDICCC